MAPLPSLLNYHFYVVPLQLGSSDPRGLSEFDWIHSTAQCDPPKLRHGGSVPSLCCLASLLCWVLTVIDLGHFIFPQSTDTLRGAFSIKCRRWESSMRAFVPSCEVARLGPKLLSAEHLLCGEICQVFSTGAFMSFCHTCDGTMGSSLPSASTRCGRLSKLCFFHVPACTR